MNRLTEAASRYLKDCTWKDIAMLKVCLLTLGILIGLALPGRKKRAAAWASALAFAATYVSLLGGFLPYLLGERVAIEDIYG